MKDEIEKICSKLETLGLAYEEYADLLGDQSGNTEFEKGALLLVLNEKYNGINKELCSIARN